jgi:hypothetical protein
MLETLEMS